MEINDLLSKVKSDCRKHISNGDIHAFMVTMTGTLSGLRAAELYDPRESLGDQSETLFDLFDELVVELESYLTAAVLNSTEVIDSVSLVTQWFMTNYQLNASPGYHDRLSSKLANFHGDSLEGLRPMFLEDLVARRLFPLTYLTVLRNLDLTAWIRESEELAASNKRITMKLLDYLKDNNNEAFYSNARALFPVFSWELVDLLAQYVDPAIDRNLAREIWEFKVMHQNRVADYITLTGIFDDITEKESFLNQLSTSWRTEFYVEILAYEGLFDRILILAKSKDIYLTKIEVMLKHILAVYPKECLTIAKHRVELEMKNGKLDRHTYTRIASLLGAVGENKEVLPEIRQFARNLMVIHSRRSALREELMKARLI